MKLLTSFHLQTETKYINYKLEQYLQFFVNHRQKNWLEWLVIAKFVVNNKIYSATKVFSFIVNYGRKLRIRIDIRRKGKVEKTMEFAKRIKKVQEKVRIALKKA